MKKLMAAAVLAAIAGIDSPYQPRALIRKERPEKECLNCGVIHNHNNRYCSAECCKAHKATPPPTEGEVK